MQTTPANVAQLFDSTRCLWIPPYQRKYEWGPDRWQALVADIKRLLDNPAAPGAPGGDHWFGIIMTADSARKCSRSADELGHVDWELIDGQQRVLTLRVWIKALFDAASDERIALTAPTYSTVVPQEANHGDLEAVLSGNWKAIWHSRAGGGLFRAYEYFRYLLWLGEAALASDDPLALPKFPRRKDVLDPIEHWKAQAALGRLPGGHAPSRTGRPRYRDLLETTVTRARFLVLEHQPALDEAPAELFSSLNGQRLELLQFDNVRNWIFSRIPDHAAMMSIYDGPWRDRERQLEGHRDVRVKGVDVADAFLYDYLIARGETSAQAISRTRTSAHFIRYATSERCPDRNDQAALASNDLLPALGAWIAVKSHDPHVGIDLSPEVRRTLRRIDAISRGPAVPLLVPLVESFSSGRLLERDLLQGLKAVEGMLARMLLADRPFSPLRSRVMEVAGRIGRGGDVRALRRELSALTPTDDEVRSWWRGSGPFNSMPSAALLAVFHAVEATREGALCKNLFDVSGPAKFTVEHIYPKNGTRWTADLKRWGTKQSSMESLLDHIGNLAVVPNALNSKLRNKTFAEKRGVMRASRGHAELSLNREWVRGRSDRWTPDRIRDRADRILADMLRYWPRP